MTATTNKTGISHNTRRAIYFSNLPHYETRLQETLKGLLETNQAFIYLSD